MATKGYYDNATSAHHHHHHHSSIALLQERFRQLQRAKEMRKEKELLRLFSEPGHRTCTNSTNNNNSAATGLFPQRHHHSARAQSSHHHQGSIYLQPNLQSKLGFQGGERSTASSNNIVRAYYEFEDYSDVDTSLHL